MYWLIVERPENWEVDRKSGFAQFGLPERKEKMGNRVSKGDRLIVYISSGISCFADVRCVESDGPVRVAGISDYDDVFPLALKTEPLVTLPTEKWVPIKDLIQDLEFTKDLKDWRQAMRSSLRPLTEKDGDLLLSIIQRASE